MLGRIRIGNGNGRGFGLILLAYQLFALVGVTRIPKATGAVIALQVAIFLRWIKLGNSIHEVCLNADAVLAGSSEYHRLWTAALTHASDLHLCYNMVSLAWNGIRLERRYGSLKFFLLLNLFCVTSSVLYVALSLLAANVLEDASYTSRCAVGFSSILFALKVLIHQLESTSWQDFGFFSVPKSLAIWIELLIIQMLVPETSFLGHLAGIISGLIYTNVNLPLRLLVGGLKATMPAATLISCLTFSLLHFDVVSKPWETRPFFVSKSSVVCLDAKNVIDNGQWIRVLSAPLEHHGSVHFFICLTSFFVKAKFLESSRPRAFFNAIISTLVALLATSLVYVALSRLLEALTNYGNSPDCVQGLSGMLFAFKVVTLYDLWSGAGCGRNWALMFFELAESLILVEKTNLLFHLSGVLVGVLCCTFRWRTCVTSVFPGRGNRLGGRARDRPDATRSWGYAGQESRFRDGGGGNRCDRHHPPPPPADVGQGGLEDSFEEQADEEIDARSGAGGDSALRTSLPPSAPAAFPPPPPPPGGGEISTDDDDDDLDGDDGVLDQIDRSPTVHTTPSR